MLPPLKIVSAGLRRTTEALAAELASPCPATPAWNSEEWRLAAAATAVHGIAPLLARTCQWRHAEWLGFLASQRAHVIDRHRHLATLLARIDAAARTDGFALVALKGSALHALGLYAAGDRPMADIDLLVHPDNAERAARVLLRLGHSEAYAQWKHRVFKPPGEDPHNVPTLGEHRDTPINIELHTRIQERLPVSVVDITAEILAPRPPPGLNPYPSIGALMRHLLLHAAGNICNRNLRLLQLHDIALLAARMTDADWRSACDADAEPAWWSLPPLYLTARYFPGAIPAEVLAGIERGCPTLLRSLVRHQTLTQLSCSQLWLEALPGIEWSRSIREAARYVDRRLRPSPESRQERADMIRTQAWLQGQEWVAQSHRRRLLTRLVRPVPRMDTLYAVRAAFASATTFAA